MPTTKTPRPMLADDFMRTRRKPAQSSVVARKFTTNALGAQSAVLFVGRLPRFGGAKLEVVITGNVGGVDFGQVTRTFDLFRATADVKVRSNTETPWTMTVQGGGAISANFFSLGAAVEDTAQFLIGVGFTSSADSTFCEARATIVGDYIDFGAIGGSQLNENVDTVAIFPVTGQSNAQGYNSQTYTTLDVLDPGRAQMFNKGLRMLSDITDAAEVVPSLAFRALVDAKESHNEPTLSWQTFGTTFMNGYLQAKASSIGAVMPNVSVGGQTYDALKLGTQPFNNLLNVVQQARSIAAAEGRTPKIPAIICDHGESNSGDTKTTYLARLLQWQTDYNNALAEPSQIPFIGSQYSHSQAGGPPHAWLQAAVSYPDRFVIAGPKYQFDYTDGIHLDGFSVARYGYYLARALRLWQAGVSRPFMYIETAAKTGNKVLLTVHMAITGTSLVLDTTTVTDPGGVDPYGLRYQDDAGQTISSVAITGANTIELTLSGSAAAVNGKVFVAQNSVVGSAGGRTTGPRACFRDNTDETCSLPTVGTLNLYNWLCHQIVDVT